MYVEKQECMTKQDFSYGCSLHKRNFSIIDMCSRIYYFQYSEFEVLGNLKRASNVWI